MRRFNIVHLARQGIAAIFLFSFSFVACADQVMRALPAPAGPQPVAALPAIQQTITPAVSPTSSQTIKPKSLSGPAAPVSQKQMVPPTTGTGKEQLPEYIKYVCPDDGTPKIFYMQTKDSREIVGIGTTLHENDSLFFFGCNFGKSQGYIGMVLSSNPGKGLTLIPTGWSENTILDVHLNHMPSVQQKSGPYQMKIVAFRANGQRMESLSSEQFYFMNEKAPSAPVPAAMVKQGPLSPVATVMQGPLPEVIIDGGGMQIGGKFVAFGNTIPVSINSPKCNFPFQFPLKNIGAGKADNFAISIKVNSENDQNLAMNAPVGGLSLEPGAIYTETHNGTGLNLVSGFAYNFTVQIDSEHKLKQATPARTYSASFKISCGSVRKKPLPYIPIN
jgi:hypothetical protein